MIRITRQHGYIMLPVVILLTLVATVAFMLNNESALDSGITASNLELKQVEYVAQAGLKNALWQTRQQGCGPYSDITNKALGNDSYTTTLTTDLGSTTGYTIAVDQDSWIRDDLPTDNMASDNKLHIRNQVGVIERPMFRYDLSSIPSNDSILSARAWFYVSKAHPEGPVDIHRLNADWTETNATWDTMGASMDTVVVATIPAQPAAGVWVAVNLTSQVQAWVNGEPNYGITLNSISEGTHGDYASREAGQQPYLEVVVGTSPSSPATLQSVGTLASGISRAIARDDVGLYQHPSHRMLQLQPGAGKDAMLSGFYNNRNYGDHRLRVSLSGSLRNSLLQFDVAAIPAGARLISAELQLHHTETITAGADAGVTVHRVNRDWVEGTKSGTGTADGATWDTWDGLNAWSTAGGDYDPAALASSTISAAIADWESWDITTLVQGWIDGSYANNGLLLMGTGAVNISFASRENADPTLWPKLVVSYSCECGSPCIAPQGSGKIALIGDDSSPDPDDQLKIGIIESWGYQVDFYEDRNSDTINWSNYDLAYVSETTISSDVAANLTVLSIGVVNEEPKLYDDLEIASGDTEHVGSSINITDNSHYITTIFPQGALSIYNGDMEILTANTPLAAGLQTLGEFSGQASLTALDQGAPTTSGTAAGRRVTLPLGQHFAAGFDWTHLNNNGHLLVQRALQWGTGNTGSVATDSIILSTDSAATLGGLAFDDIDLVEYNPVASSASLFFEGALTTLNTEIDALHVLGDGRILLSTKDAATLGGLSFADGDLVEYDPVTDTAAMYFIESAFSADEDIVSVYVMNNGHILLSTDSDATLGGLSFTDNDLVEYDTGSDTATLYFDGSTTTLTSDIDAVHLLGNGHIVLSTKDDASLGGLSFNDGDLVQYDPDTDTAVRYFSEGLFAAGEDVISAHIGPGSGDSLTGNRLLLVVVNPSSLTVQEAARKTLIESWLYTVSLIDESDSTANFDAAIAANDVAYIPQGINSANLGSRLANASIGVVNEEGEQVDELGFASDKLFKNRHEIDIVDNSHYITEPFATGLLTFVSSDQSVHMLISSLAPGLSTLATSLNVGSQWEPSLAVLDAGDEISGGGNAAGRRVQLPWGGGAFDINQLTDDGRVIMRRAIEWGAGAAALIAHWKFDEGSGPTAFDSVGGNDATLNGSPGWTTGTLGDALDFNGSSDYVTTDSNFTPPPVGTVTFWMQVSGSPASQGRILGLDDTWEIRHVTTGTPDGIPYGLVFDLGVTGVNTEFVTTTTVDTPGQWYHIAASYDTINDAYAVYIDGVPHKNGTYPSALAVPAAGLLSIGTRTGSTNYFDGVLDDVRIYDQFLTAAEIGNLVGGGGGPPP